MLFHRTFLEQGGSGVTEYISVEAMDKKILKIMGLLKK